MKIKNILFLLILSFFLPVFCYGAFNISEWKYYKEIKGSGSSLIRVNIDDEIFSSANKNLSDLRVINQNNQEIPFKIVANNRKVDQIDYYPAKMINNSFISGQFSSVILDVEGDGKLVNSLTIKTSSENFQRNVKIYGSDDRNNWNVLKSDAYIYDYTDKKGNFKSQNTKVNFSESAFRYLKVEVSDENGSPIKIDSVYVSKETPRNIHEFERSPNFSQKINDKNRSTEILIDLEASGIPANKINIRTEDHNFNREISIYSSADNDKWKFVDRGYIFRYIMPKFNGESMTIDFSETHERYLKVEIFNKDNSQLNISGVSVFSTYRELVFPAKENERYRIYYGNKKALYPEYDLDKFFQYLDLESAQLATLGAKSDNMSYVPEKEPEKPLSERIPYLFSGMLAIMGLILLFLVYKFLKK